MPEIEEFAEGHHDLIVLDDLAHEALGSATTELLFTQGCHNKKLSVVFITHMYGQGKSARTIVGTWCCLKIFAAPLRYKPSDDSCSPANLQLSQKRFKTTLKRHTATY